jgi:glycosyltransferase involved in cell wall biosynthesis
MKIIFVSNGLKVGGAEKFLLTIINGFADRGYHPVLILLDDENPLLSELNRSVKTYVIKRKFRYDISVSLKIRKTIIQEAVSKVICIETYPFFVSKLLFQFNKKTKFYLSLHNSLPISWKQHFVDIVYLKAFRKSDTAIFICNYQKQCFHDRYFMQPFNSVIIYNGIDTNYFSNLKARSEIPQEIFRWKTRLGLNENSKIVLMIGRLSKEKGHPYAIEALKYLHNQLNMEAHLVIVGSGPETYLKNLKEKSAKLSIDKYVHFAGSNSEVRPFLLEADIFTLTSFSETFSIAALEAMSCGMPCSLTNVGGAAEMVINQKIGILSESRNPASIAESWKRLLSTTHNREYISAYTASRFSLEKMMNEYLSLIGN